MNWPYTLGTALGNTYTHLGWANAVGWAALLCVGTVQRAVSLRVPLGLCMCCLCPLLGILTHCVVGSGFLA